MTDPRAMIKWSPPHGYMGAVHAMDLRPGGWYRMSFISLGTGAAHSFGGNSAEVVPDQLFRYTDRFDAPELVGATGVSMTLA